MDYRYLIIPASLLLLLFTILILFHLKRKSVMRKVDALSTKEKNSILNSLGEPFGYLYDSGQDLFVARHDAPQKHFGYHRVYDLSAPYFNMVFDYETFYFDYNARTWLIQIWKGQYGINTGCELGIYYADEIVPPEKYSTTLFHAVEPQDMLDISLSLSRTTGKRSRFYYPLGHMDTKHWWLTLFRMGHFTKPEELFVDTAIRFKDYSMLRQFVDSFNRTLPDTPCRINGLTVHFTFFQSTRKYTAFKRLVRRIALTSCRIYCKWFHYFTRYYSESGDKLLYLYYYLPFTIRLIFRLKKKK